MKSGHTHEPSSALATPPDLDIRARLARLEADHHALRRRMRRLAFAGGALAIVSVCVTPSIAFTQTGFSWPAGWNVFAMGTPAVAGDVNDNFQWILEKVGTEPGTISAPSLDVAGDSAVAGDSLVAGDFAVAGSIANPSGDVTVADDLRVTGLAHLGWAVRYSVWRSTTGRVTLQAWCPNADYRVTGGGLDSPTVVYQIVDSRPISNGSGVWGWEVEIWSSSGQNSNAVRSAALCLRVR